VSNVLHIAYTFSTVLQELVFGQNTLSSQMFLSCFYLYTFWLHEFRLNYNV
jgi:hypothetical protein